MVIKLSMSNTKNVIKELKQINEIKQISHLAGIYDLMLEIEAENIEVINDLLVEKIDLIDGVVDTNTFIVLKDYK
ncbi:MAG: Lrp/AsnC ligand binding domain-containing protein [Candidatus Helarchaeota archaeon]|nr:Lrp/AsnC ligand binding domain-containing protein [Candidatus Helarchaeota archaeon]